MFVDVASNDPETEAYFSRQADLAAMMRFEVALAQAQSEVGVISAAAANHIAEKAGAFEPDMRALEDAFLTDGLVVPALIRAFRAELDQEHRSALHKGSTSQDVIDTSLMLRLAECESHMLTRIEKLISAIKRAVDNREDAKLMGRTRMQAALPITVGQKARNWTAAIEAATKNAPSDYLLQMGGPVGTWNDDDSENTQIAQNAAQKLGLKCPDHPWHTDRSVLLRIAQWYGQIANATGKIARDLLLMAQNGVDEAEALSGGSSSAMAHKKNPVICELVLSQAAYVNTLLAGLNQHAIHENERSGEKWTLEWILLPKLVIAAGCTLRLGVDMLEGMKIKPSE